MSGGLMVIVAENARAGSTLRDPVQGSYLIDKETEAQREGRSRLCQS